jgi:ketosteroid isomerase-like protein
MMVDIETMLRSYSSESKAWMKTSLSLDQRILELSKTGKRNLPRRTSIDLIRWIPLAAMFLFLLSLPFFTNGRSDRIKEKDCIQFYAQLTRAIHEKDLETLLSAYGSDIAPENRKLIQARIEELFNSCSSLDLEPSSVTIVQGKQEALLKSEYRMSIEKRDGTRESRTGTDRLYMRKTSEGLRLCLWITE